MSFLRDRTQRRLVPRWKASSSAGATPDFISIKPAPVVKAHSDDRLGAATYEFECDRCVGTAADALAESLLEGNGKASRAAAAFVLQDLDGAPKALIELARHVTSEAHVTSLDPVQEDVRSTRALLRLAPKNPVLWSDMARHYATRGDKRHALRCMQTALQLAPNHRWMLRTAARFYIHQGDSASAHRMLANHPRTKNDPWLVAAELACAQVAGRAPKYWRVANDIIKFDRYSPLHTSELATAIGMMELEAGERKKARKLVQKGLVAPTENTLAQVCWAKDQKHLGDSHNLDSLIVSADDAYEAEFKLRLRRGDLQNALLSATTWTKDEPFAARPKAEIAYLGSLLDDHDLTIRMAGEVLRIDGRVDENLELNRIFAQLSSRALSLEAHPQEIQRIEARLTHLVEHSESSAYHATANLALWHYRYGNQAIGKVLYRSAIEAARKVHGNESAALAAVFAAREALIAREPGAFEELTLARELAKRADSAACFFYLRKLEALVQAPDREGVVLSPSSAHEFLEQPAKPRILKVERTKTSYVLTIGQSSLPT